MQNVIVGSVLFLCSLPVIGGGMRIASDFRPKSVSPIVLDVSQEPLWTAEVKRVDPREQAYERLPPAFIDAPKLLASHSGSRSEPLNRGGTPVMVNTAESDVEAKADEWCSNRYRSYLKADKSYQPFGGGPRQRCIPPTEVAQPETGQQVASIDDNHVASCTSRYRSYRVEDNSYQPFSGPRRQCQSGSQMAYEHYRRVLLAQQASN